MTSVERSVLAVMEGDVTDETGQERPAQRLHARNPDVVWVEAVSGRCALADIADFRQFDLVGPAAGLWSRLDGFASDDEVVRDVLASYPGHPDTAYGECVSFIETMTDRGLLVLQPRAGRGAPDDVGHPDEGGLVAQPAQKGTVT